MDQFWAQLSTDQTILLRGLSSDLHGPNASKQSKSDFAKIPQFLLEARSGVFPGAWTRFLKALRECEGLMPETMLNFFKSQAWGALGDPSAAVTFLDRAAKNEPSDPSFSFLALSQLWKFDEEEALSRIEHILSDPSSPILLRLKSAEILFSEAESDLTVNDAKLRRAIRVFESVLHDPRKKDLPPRFRSSGWVMVGLGYRSLGNSEKELAAYDNAIAEDSTNLIAKTARGVFLYGRDTKDAIREFKDAIANNVDLVWPYLFLTHYALVQSNFREAMEMAQAGLRHAAIPEIRAELLQWYAISRYEIERNEADLIEILSNVTESAPLNLRAKANLSRATQRASSWEWPAEDEVVKLGAMHLRTRAELPLEMQEELVLAY